MAGQRLTARMRLGRLVAAVADVLLLWRGDPVFKPRGEQFQLFGITVLRRPELFALRPEDQPLQLGKAELQLIESDDPLEAGLEIIANPPGKKPTTLSLLSGGEQTLTAMSLIFAVFLTNPSPICVLDEVDAPLDDHNVERFCNLLDAMLERTETRFLIITHHALTMARMNRLFGVTMLERGVSQLVSVNLQEAETLVVADTAA